MSKRKSWTGDLFYWLGWGRRSKPIVNRRKSSPLNIELLEDRLAPATCIWTGLGGNILASNAQNWSESSLPTAFDTLVINKLPGVDTRVQFDAGFIGTIRDLRISGPINPPDGVQVTFSRNITIERSFIHDGGNLTGNGVLEIGPGADYEWLGGHWTDLNAVAIRPGATLNVNSANIHAIDTGILSNEGTLTLANNAAIASAYGFTLNNSTTGLVAFQSRGDALVCTNSQNRILIINDGTITKNGDDGDVAAAGIELWNNALINVASGNLHLGGAGSFAVGSAVNVAPTAAVTLESGEFTFNNSFTLNSGNLVLANGGRLNVATPMSVANLVMSGGNITGDETLTVTREMFWNDGRIEGDGYMNIGQNALLHVPAGGMQALGRIFNIYGKIDWSYAETASLPGGAPGQLFAYPFINLRTGENATSVKRPDNFFASMADQYFGEFHGRLAEALDVFKAAEAQAAQTFDIGEAYSANQYQAAVAFAQQRYDFVVAQAQALLDAGGSGAGDPDEEYWDAVAAAEGDYDSDVAAAMDTYRQQVSALNATYVSAVNTARDGGAPGQGYNADANSAYEQFHDRLLGQPGLIPGAGSAFGLAAYFCVLIYGSEALPSGYYSRCDAAWGMYLNLIPVQQIALQVAFQHNYGRTITAALGTLGTSSPSDSPAGGTTERDPSQATNESETQPRGLFARWRDQIYTTVSDLTPTAPMEAMSQFTQDVVSNTAGFVRDVGNLAQNDPVALRNAFVEGVRDGALIQANALSFGAITPLNQHVSQIVAQNGGLYRASQVCGAIAREAIVSALTAGVAQAAPSIASSIATRLGVTEATQATIICYATTFNNLYQPVSAVLQIQGITSSVQQSVAAYRRGDYETAATSLMQSGLNAVSLFGSLRETLRMVRAFGSLDPQRMRDYLTNCFTAETPVLTKRGWIPFAELAVWDEVASRDENNPDGPVEFKAVEETFRTVAPIWHLHVGGQVIRTTDEHPFYVKDHGWTAAKDLQEGDLLPGHDGRWTPVEEVLDAGYEDVVYNCRIADYHTYFVGDDDSWGFSVWAHNLCVTPLPRRNMPQRDSNGYRVYGTAQNTTNGGQTTGHGTAIDNKVAEITAQLQAQGVNPNDVTIVLNRNWRTAVNGLGRNIPPGSSPGNLRPDIIVVRRVNGQFRVRPYECRPSGETAQDADLMQRMQNGFSSITNGRGNFSLEQPIVFGY
ncbi:MAG: hypothetical protein HYR84_00995 [Planctomycetes bacterium]|nr:hypothetical protein [Planctomycetota bacterium]